MADWTNIPNESLEPDAPVRSIDGLAFRDNPIAIAEGAPGAPSVLPGIADRSNAGGLGTYGLFFVATGGAQEPGSLISGSSLRYTSGSATGASGTPSGTWQAMGRTTDSGGGSNSITVFLRVA